MKTVARLSEQERKELFSETAVKMGVTASAAEKDFWICWVLLHVFEDNALGQCLRFKGGTITMFINSLKQICIQKRLNNPIYWLRLWCLNRCFIQVVGLIMTVL